MKKVLMCVLALVVAEAAAYAVPVLQLYMPGAVYDMQTETWISYQNPFTLQVLGASHNGNVIRLSDVTLDIAVPDAWWEPGGSVMIEGPGYSDGVTITQFQYGTAPRQSSHGIYPAHYCTVAIPDMEIQDASDVIQNYSPAETGTDTGVILEYHISYTGFFGIHLDASGIEWNKNERTQDVFVPYSHDADADEPVGEEPTAAEPAGLLLLGLAALRARRRARSK